jgi:hypothetical protein
MNVQTAQRHGFFCANEGQVLDDELFSQILDLDAKWKAWSRVECVKRYVHRGSEYLSSTN